MATLIEPKSPPTSAGAAKSQVKSVGRIAWGAVILTAGVGLAVMARPYLSRVPVFGALVNAGAETLRPSAPHAVDMDAAWGVN